MLVTLETIEPLLRCPRSGAALKRDGQHFTVPGTTHRYSIVGGVPVLIDFDSSVASSQYARHNTAVSAIDRPAYEGFKGFLKRLVSPEMSATRRNVASLIRQLFQLSAKPLILIVGGGTVGQGMGALLCDPDILVATFDIYRSAITQFVADAHSIPIEDAAFDGVVIQAVLEHVLEPQQVVDEIWRVLKPAGLVYAETPFLQHVHEGPYDFSRFTESGHRYLFRRFDCLDSGVIGGPGTQLLWSIDYFVRSLFRSRIMGKAAKLLFCWLRLFDMAIPSKFASDAASGTFILGRKVENPMTPKEIVDFYKGAE